jgi:hypothetical protein
MAITEDQGTDLDLVPLCEYIIDQKGLELGSDKDVEFLCHLGSCRICLENFIIYANLIRLNHLSHLTLKT